MCVIFHKPAGVALPAPLLTAAASLNRDGWGLMGFDAQGELLLERGARVDADELIAHAAEHETGEVVFHLRLLTRGSTHPDNLHPIPVVDGVLLMHNGTLEGLDSAHPGRSDSWHFATRVLRPLLQRDPDLILQPAFQALVELALGAGNRAVLLHHPSRRVLVLNRHLGAEVDGIWCSNTRWIDERLYPLPAAPQRQERSLPTEHLRFI